MKILCVCNEGNNRSVHLAHLLRYSGHDTLAAGVRRAGPETLRMLTDWADLVIVTDDSQASFLDHPRIEVWSIPDSYPRPFNPEQHAIVKDYVQRSGL